MADKRIKISQDQRSLALFLRTENGDSYRDIADKCRISKSSAERIVREFQGSTNRSEGGKIGRPRKLTERNVRLMLRTLKEQRSKGKNVTVKSLVQESGLTLKMASRRTFSRVLNEHGFHHLQARKKGLVSDKDRKKRMKFARSMKSWLKSKPNFFTHEVAFYLLFTNTTR